MKDRSIRTFTRLAALTVALLLLVSCAAAEAVDTKTADPYIKLSTPYRWRKSRRAGRAPSVRAATR